MPAQTTRRSLNGAAPPHQTNVPHLRTPGARNTTAASAEDEPGTEAKVGCRVEDDTVFRSGDSDDVPCEGVPREVC